MVKVVVKKSKIHGKGVFAARNFKKGEVVNKWKPISLTEKEVSKLSKKDEEYLSYLGKRKYALMQSPEKYVNHSCEPNTKAKGKSDVAIRAIKKGEEITSDYSTHCKKDWKMRCKCKSKKCKKIMRGKLS